MADELDELLDPDFGGNDSEEEKEEEKNEEDEIKDDEEDEEKKETREDDEIKDDDEKDEEKDDDSTKKYKEDHPEIFEKVARAEEYEKEFESVEQARAAKGDAIAYQNLLSDLTESRSLKGVLSQIHQDQPDMVKDMAETFLADIADVDKSLADSIARPVVQNLISGIYQKGMTAGDKNLVAAAKYFQRELFGNTSPTRAAPSQPREEKTDKPSKREQKLEERNNQLMREQAEGHVKDVGSNVRGKIEAKIDQLVKKQNLPGPIGRSVKRDVLDALNKEAEEDTSYNDDLRRKWSYALKQNFHPDALKSIRQHMISKANKVIPKAAQAAIKEWGGEDVIRRGKESRKPEHGENAKENKGSAEPSKGMSDLEFLQA